MTDRRHEHSRPRHVMLLAMPASFRPFSLAAVLALAALVCVYAGLILQGMVHRVAPTLAPPMLATASLSYVLFTGRLPRGRASGPQTLPAAVLLTLVAAPVFAGLAHVALALPIVKTWSGRDPELVASATRFLGAVVASTVLMGLAARGTRAPARRQVRLLLALAAPTALALEVALVVAGLSSGRPAPNGYVTSLPVLARISATLPTPGEDVTVVGDVAITRRCGRVRGCGVWLTRRWTPPAAVKPDFTVDDPALLIRRDAARDLWVVDGTAGREGNFVDDEPTHQAAYRGPTMARVKVGPSALLGGLAPPRGWLAAAAVGAVVAGRRLMRRRAATRELAEILAAEAGTMDEGGWVTLDRGGDPLRAPTELAPGPVLVVLPRGSRAGAYRTDAARPAERVLAGTRAILGEEARRAVATIDARALAAAVITAAPLATAWLEGLR